MLAKDLEIGAEFGVGSFVYAKGKFNSLPQEVRDQFYANPTKFYETLIEDDVDMVVFKLKRPQQSVIVIGPDNKEHPQVTWFTWMRAESNINDYL